MADEQLRVTTEAQRERLHMARRDGDWCSACGRALSPNETVYWERFVLAIGRSTAFGRSGYSATVEAPVGAECISLELLQQTINEEPERCAACGRGVHYRVSRSTRHRALCSRRCASRADRIRRSVRPRAEA